VEVLVLAVVGAAEGDLEGVAVGEEEFPPETDAGAPLLLLLDLEAAVLVVEDGTVVAHEHGEDHLLAGHVLALVAVYLQ